MKQFTVLDDIQKEIEIVSLKKDIAFFLCSFSLTAFLFFLTPTGWWMFFGGFVLYPIVFVLQLRVNYRILIQKKIIKRRTQVAFMNIVFILYGLFHWDMDDSRDYLAVLEFINSITNNSIEYRDIGFLGFFSPCFYAILIFIQLQLVSAKVEE